jgi:hypothetical protein
VEDHDATPGSLQLAELIDTYGSALDADFALAGLDLRDVFRDHGQSGPGLTPRRALNIINHLPETSNFAAYARFELMKKPAAPHDAAVVRWRDFKGFGTDRELLMTVVDAIQALHVSFIASKRTKGSGPAPQFKPLDRPGDQYKRVESMWSKLFSLASKGGGAR